MAAFRWSTVGSRLFVLAGCSAVLFMAARGVDAQQAVYDYFSRTAESQHVLDSNEYNHLNKGIEHLRRGQPHELQYAKGEFDFILNYWPNHPRVLALQAEALMKMGQAPLIDS